MGEELLYADRRYWSDLAWLYGVLFFIMGSPVAYWTARVTRSRLPWLVLVVLPILIVAETGVGYLAFLDKCEKQTHMRQFANAPSERVRYEEQTIESLYFNEWVKRAVSRDSREILAEVHQFQFKSGVLARSIAGETEMFTGMKQLVIRCWREYPEEFASSASLGR